METALDTKMIEQAAGVGIERNQAEAGKLRKNRRAKDTYSKIIAEWNQIFTCYKDSKIKDSRREVAAKFVLHILDLDLYEDNLKEKFWDKYGYNAYPYKDIREVEELFIDTIFAKFSEYQVSRYKDIIYNISWIFYGSDNIKMKIQNRLKKMSFLTRVVGSIKVKNLKQAMRENIGLLRYYIRKLFRK